MARESGPDIKYCQKCGAQSSKTASTCPSCGHRAGNNNVATIIIVIVVLGVMGLGTVTVLGILAAIALPNFIGAQHKAKTAAVKANSRTVQICAECYATDTGGLYPTRLDDKFKSYFPGGSNGDSRGTATPGNPLTNPITGEAGWPVMGKVSNVVDARNSPPEFLGKGVVEYSVILDNRQQPSSYAIRCGDANGMTAQGTNGKPLVLSNQ